MTCVFCNPDHDLRDRVFYEDGRWRAFLSSPPHTSGHTILAAMPLAKNAPESGRCPQVMSGLVLSGLDIALPLVTSAIVEAYEPKPLDILFASLRGDLRHFHLHLIPLWEDGERCWRKITGYRSAHLMEFLGSLEKRHDFEVLWNQAEARGEEQRSEAQQRTDCTKTMTDQVDRLRRITGYKDVHDE
jgi:diadenosine tetraphosphate (Ap4A) HIT family hydrolase